LGPSLTVGARIEAVEVCGEGEFDCWAGTLRVRRVVCGPIPADESPVALFDARQLRFPLLVRQWKEGDRILPFGGTGRKKLSDLFIDRKIPRAARRQVPVVTDCQEAVLWVVGVQRSAHWPALPGEPAIELTFDSPAGLATMPRS
jgi:tRNA(Ile)-lysidine synthase